MVRGPAWQKLIIPGDSQGPWWLRGWYLVTPGIYHQMVAVEDHRMTVIAQGNSCLRLNTATFPDWGEVA
jgi:hypothetical protein